jgi:signal transduction histidine kinase
MQAIDLWRICRPYIFAILALVVATVARMSLNPWLEDRQAFMTFFAAVIITSWIAGMGPSLLALAGGLALASWFFLPPRHSFAVAHTYNQIAVLSYLGLGLPVVLLGGRLWRAREQAERAEALCGTQARQLDSERKRLQQDLARLTEELRDVDRRREDFLGLLAEELRRPLVPIASAASFHSVAATASEMETAMDIVKQETTQLGRLIDDLLDAFRNNQGDITLNRRRIDLVEIANWAVATVRSLAAQSGRELNVSLVKEPVWVDGDAQRLERVAYNLLMNAIRSTNPGGQIWISVQSRDGAAMLKVKDTGIGLSQDAIPRVFQINSQLDGSLPRERGGLGVSLTAVKPIVEIHGGMVTVHSDGPGQGCEFIVRLPLSSASPTESPAAHEQKPAVGESDANNNKGARNV